MWRFFTQKQIYLNSIEDAISVKAAMPPTAILFKILFS